MYYKWNNRDALNDHKLGICWEKAAEIKFSTNDYWKNSEKNGKKTQISVC